MFSLRTIIALGYNISMDKPPARIRAVRLPNDPFLQSNGYKPAPLDLSAIELTAKMEELVDLLAENTHNLWAKERISQGWTYGLNEVSIAMSEFYFVGFPFKIFQTDLNEKKCIDAQELHEHFETIFARRTMHFFTHIYVFILQLENLFSA